MKWIFLIISFVASGCLFANGPTYNFAFINNPDGEFPKEEKQETDSKQKKGEIFYDQVEAYLKTGLPYQEKKFGVFVKYEQSIARKKYSHIRNTGNGFGLLVPITNRFILRPSYSSTKVNYEGHTFGIYEVYENKMDRFALDLMYYFPLIRKLALGFGLGPVYQAGKFQHFNRYWDRTSPSTRKFTIYGGSIHSEFTADFASFRFGVQYSLTHSRRRIGKGIITEQYGWWDGPVHVDREVGGDWKKENYQQIALSLAYLF